jgi:hypothetical protein
MTISITMILKWSKAQYKIAVRHTTSWENWGFQSSQYEDCGFWNVVTEVWYLYRGVKNAVFWKLTPCNPTEDYRRFGGKNLLPICFFLVSCLVCPSTSKVKQYINWKRQWACARLYDLTFQTTLHFIVIVICPCLIEIPNNSADIRNSAK